MSDEVLTSSWCTAWDSYNTPRLWSMVMNEDDTVGRAQVSAWRTLAGSVSDQRAALVAAKAELVAAWPPEQNASAESFVRELDILISRLDTAALDAESTANGLDRIMNALQTAKTQIEPLWEQYKDKSDDLVPRWFDSAEDELDEQARRAMIAAEATVQDSVAMLKVPDPYQLNGADEKGGRRELPTGDGLSSTFSAPGGGGGGAGSGISVPVPHDPVPPLPGREPIVPDAGSGAGGVGGGPDLAGVITPPPPATLPGAVPLPGGGAPLPVPGGGGGLTPILPGVLPGGLGIGGPPPGGRGVVPPGGVGGVPPGGRGLRPPTSGVIGDRSGLGRVGLGDIGGARPAGMPIGGMGGPGGVPATGAPGGRAARNRIGTGGVIGRSGEPPHGSASAARGLTPAPRPSWLPNDPVGPNRHAMTPGLPGQAPARRRGEGEQAAFDPDNPWQVAEGVRPVIAPGVQHDRHDPGPHVIGRHG